MHTHINRPNSSLDWVLFITGPISLCLDSFLCMHVVYAVYGEVDMHGGTEARSLGELSLASLRGR